MTLLGLPRPHRVRRDVARSVAGGGCAATWPCGTSDLTPVMMLRERDLRGERHRDKGWSCSFLTPVKALLAAPLSASRCPLSALQRCCALPALRSARTAHRLSLTRASSAQRALPVSCLFICPFICLFMRLFIIRAAHGLHGVCLKVRCGAAFEGAPR
eukprot:414859-Rhodomonas_salina.2